MKKDISILLAEDDTNLGFVIKDLLEDEGYDVKLATDGVAALQKFNEMSFDLCLLDVMMPLKDGFTLAENIRASKPDMPIIFLTARGVTEDKVRGLKLGADDYITKPFENEEFLLRIENVLKRTGKQKRDEPTPDVIQIGSFSLDHKNLMLTYADGTQQKLTAKEAKILRILGMSANRVMERELVLNAVWGKDDYFTGRSMDVFITKLRKYLSLDPKIKIVNIHGVGFKLEIEE
ncbi:MAG TPA: response regulator transcription factor [Bacteroidia bacterium]